MAACTHILSLCVVKAILRKKSRPGQARLSDFRLHYKAAVVKRVWSWHKSKCQWDGTEINPRTCGQLIDVEGGESVYTR